MNVTITGEALLKFLSRQEQSYRTVGNFNKPVLGFCSLKNPSSNCILWVKHPEGKTFPELNSLENIVIVSPEEFACGAKNCRFVLTQEPKAVFFSVLKHFWKGKKVDGIALSAVVESDRIGEHVSIGQHCYVSPEVEIGSGTILEHNVVILHRVVIGKNCIIHSGTVIGTDGFGYYVDHAGRPCKVEHYGGVQIGDDVEIGANTCVDRGTLNDTVIGDHCKIDNLVHIAHNVTMEENVMVVAQSLVAGSATLKKGSYVAPGAIVQNQMTVGAEAFIGMGAVVTKDVAERTVVAGVPARVLRKVRPTDK